MPLTSEQEQCWQEAADRLQEYLASLKEVKESRNIEAFRSAWDGEKKALNAYFEARQKYMAARLP